MIPTHPQRLSELDAVNMLFYAAGEEPVSTLDDNGLEDAQSARFRLYHTSREEQSRGWRFNSFMNRLLTRTVGGEILVPVNVLHMDIARSEGRSGVQHGDKLYDDENHTYVWDRDLKTDMVVFLPWDSLPDPMRSYVAVRAARIYQRQRQGDNSVERFTADDEMRAFRRLRRDQRRVGDLNIYKAPDMPDALMRLPLRERLSL